MKLYHTPSKRVYDVYSIDNVQSTVTVLKLPIYDGKALVDADFATYPQSEVVFLRESPARDDEGNKVGEADKVRYGDGLVCSGVVTFDQGEWVALETDEHFQDYTGKRFCFTETIPANLHKVGSKYRSV